ncbi:acetyltransferase [Klebsiella oxytoca]|nr:acetyltransferase [Klebsiella oxytoca]
MIQPLYAAPQHASRVTEWLWRAFGGETLPQAFFASIVGHSQTPGALPMTFIAAEGETLLGTVGLWRCDLISRQDLYPWMAALYVAPEARGQGLAGKLQQHVIDYARKQGYGELFLYSACRDFYERFRLAVHRRRPGLSGRRRQFIPLRFVAIERRNHRVTADQRRAEKMRYLRRRPMFRQR